MGSIKSHKDLIVWKKGTELAKEIFILTSLFPKSEIYGITSQMRRAAIAIPSNIAEGFGRRSIKGSAQFYSIAYGSALELETQMSIAKEIGLAPERSFGKSENLLLEILKMLNVMTSKL